MGNHKSTIKCINSSCIYSICRKSVKAATLPLPNLLFLELDYWMKEYTVLKVTSVPRVLEDQV